MTCLRHLGTCMMVYSSRTKGFRTSSSSKYERKSRYIQNFQKYVMMYDKALEFCNLKVNHLTLSYQMNFSIAFSAEKIYATPWTVAFSEYSLGKLKMEGLFFFIPIISEQRSVYVVLSVVPTNKVVTTYSNSRAGLVFVVCPHTWMKCNLQNVFKINKSKIFIL